MIAQEPRGTEPPKPAQSRDGDGHAPASAAPLARGLRTGAVARPADDQGAGAGGRPGDDRPAGAGIDRADDRLTGVLARAVQLRAARPPVAPGGDSDAAARRGLVARCCCDQAAVAAVDAEEDEAAIVTTSRNPAPPGEALDAGEIKTRRGEGSARSARVVPIQTRSVCNPTTGPVYSTAGVVPVSNAGGVKSAPFTFSAKFQKAPAPKGKGKGATTSTLPSCCQVRQYIKWDQAFATYNGGPPHSGFPSNAKPGRWYEDRDDQDKRYGHRAGVHSDPIAGGGDEYTTGGVQDQANGDTYNGRDTPSGPAALTGQWQFKLAAIDSCDANKCKGPTQIITINW